MLRYIIYAMIFLGAALMVFNIYCFSRYALDTRNHKAFQSNSKFLFIPVFLLVFFLLGYLAVGIFGTPDLIIAGILFGGSVFVFIVYLIIRGITRRFLANEGAEAELIALEETERAKERFLSSISHEMRTPMNVILGLNNLALRNPDLQPETRKQLEKIGLSARHLQGLIGNVLNMNQIRSGTFEIHNEPFDLSDAIAQINAIVQTLCGNKGLEYRCDAPQDAFGRYIGDEVQIKQVLLSILDNAVKYTDAPGSVTLALETVSEEKQVRTLRFRITDTGIGMDKAFLSRLFDVFSQEDASSTNRFGGTGLSLAVTKKTVELMGGTIEAESQKNVGSTFTVTLPLKRLAEPSSPVTLEGKRILLAEDIPENAEIVMDLLEIEGVETEHAENGQIALEMFKKSEPRYYDAILMDLRMPVMDGLEATRRIRALDRTDAKTVPILALTANAFESDVKQSLESGMNAHLAKPADADVLFDALKEFIGKAQLTEEDA